MPQAPDPPSVPLANKNARDHVREVGTDLFGDPVVLVEPPHAPDNPRRRWGSTVGGGRNAYPAPPGTGPEGKSCRDCGNSHATGSNRKTYWKCLLVPSTNGGGTDIRLRTPACRCFKQKEPPF